MKDHVTSEGLSRNEDAFNMILYPPDENPSIYKKASKSLNRRKAINNEIRAIKKYKSKIDFLNEVERMRRI